MEIDLVDIPGVRPEDQSEHNVRALRINKKSPALDALLGWSKKSKADYQKIMKVLRLVGQQKRVTNENHVKKNTNSVYGDVYEMRAHKGSARLLFFYTADTNEVVICTNSYWKTKASKREQNQAFKLCADLRDLYQREAS